MDAPLDFDLVYKSTRYRGIQKIHRVDPAWSVSEFKERLMQWRARGSGDPDAVGPVHRIMGIDDCAQIDLVHGDRVLQDDELVGVMEERPFFSIARAA